MKFLFEFFPILLFFLAYKLGDIYLATSTAIIASLVQVGWSRYSKGHFEKMPLVTLGTITLLGGATLLLRDEMFIKWKPTAIYWVFAVAFLISHFVGKKPLLQRTLEHTINLPSKIWTQLNLSWIAFFTLLGGANLYVVYHFDTDTWVNFKLFGTLGLTLLFVIAQGIYMARHSVEPTALQRETE